jgi:hypothetical protein
MLNHYSGKSDYAIANLNAPILNPTPSGTWCSLTTLRHQQIGVSAAVVLCIPLQEIGKRLLGYLHAALLKLV